MSDQETAVQLIRNEAAELIVRAKAAGLRVNIVDPAGQYVVSIMAPHFSVAEVFPYLPALPAAKEPK